MQPLATPPRPEPEWLNLRPLQLDQLEQPRRKPSLAPSAPLPAFYDGHANLEFSFDPGLPIDERPQMDFGVILRAFEAQARRHHQGVTVRPELGVCMGAANKGPMQVGYRNFEWVRDLARSVPLFECSLGEPAGAFTIHVRCVIREEASLETPRSARTVASTARSNATTARQQ